MKDLAKSDENVLVERDIPGNRRKAIMDLQEEILKYPQVEMPVTNHFSKDTYGRELFIPQGTLLVGKIHKYESLNILAQGDISLLTEDGIKRVQAPYVVVSKPGTKRVGFAHTDCTWVTVHGTSETDVDKIEEEFIAKDYDEVPEISEQDIKKLMEG